MFATGRPFGFAKVLHRDPQSLATVKGGYSLQLDVPSVDMPQLAFDRRELQTSDKGEVGHPVEHEVLLLEVVSDEPGVLPGAGGKGLPLSPGASSRRLSGRGGCMFRWHDSRWSALFMELKRQGAWTPGQ